MNCEGLKNAFHLPPEDSGIPGWAPRFIHDALSYSKSVWGKNPKGQHDTEDKMHFQPPNQYWLTWNAKRYRHV